MLVALLVQNGILTAAEHGRAGVPLSRQHRTTARTITFYADNPAEANAALDGLIFTPDAELQRHGSSRRHGPGHDVHVLLPDRGLRHVPITVTPVNDAPVAADDSYETGEDLAADRLRPRRAGQRLRHRTATSSSAVLVSGPAHGTRDAQPRRRLHLHARTRTTSAPDSFTYRADRPGRPQHAGHRLAQGLEMDDPIEVAVPGPQTIAEDTSITFSAANGNAFTVSDLESPRVLVALLVQDGILTLPSTAGLEFPDPGKHQQQPVDHLLCRQPGRGQRGAGRTGLHAQRELQRPGLSHLLRSRHDLRLFPPQEAFDYTQITVTPVNDAPVAVDDIYAAEAGVPFWATLGGGGSGVGVLMNDQDVDMELLTAVLVSGPAHGTLEFNSGRHLHLHGGRHLQRDRHVHLPRLRRPSSKAAWRRRPSPSRMNLPPVSVGDAYAVNEDSSLSVPAPGVLGNDSDPNGQPLTAQLVSGPAHGTLTLNPNGSFTYTPAANYNGPDEFWYRASDGTNLGDAVAVTLTVNPVNDAPVASKRQLQRGRGRRADDRRARRPGQ